MVVMGSLFEEAEATNFHSVRPLAARMRPVTLEEFLGQDHFLGEGKLLRRLLKSDRLTSVLFYGPPGTGKTTLAQLLASASRSRYEQLNAVTSGVKELRQVLESARDAVATSGRRTLLFVDEIHRFNKNQQDLFLPVIESGDIILIACTTENPSYSLNNALLSRCQTLQFKELTEKDLQTLFFNIEKSQGELNIKPEQLELIIKNSNNDARIFISNIEKIYALNSNAITNDQLTDILQTTPFKSDKTGDTHYAYFSAFQKSIRASDDAAAMLYFVKMVENGEDVLAIGRRMLVIASEDVGLADPQALIQVNTALQAFERVGQPEGLIMMAQAVNYLALAPKSNASYKSLAMARMLVKENKDIFPPKAALNATTKLQTQEGRGAGYIYDHDTEIGFAGQSLFPDNIPRMQLYHPKQIGFERDLAKRLEYFTNIRNKKK